VKRTWLALLVAIGILINCNSAYAYNSHTFENTQYLDDRPYIAQMSARAYVCVKSDSYTSTVTNSVDANGDKITTTVSYSNPVPVLYEYVANTWYWVSKDPSVNTNGNPCTNGGEALWFNDILLTVPSNSSQTFFKVVAAIYSPNKTITTVRKHHRFLIGDKVTKTNQTINGSTLFSSHLDVYRSDSDARLALVGTTNSFFSNPSAYQARDEAYGEWFPCALSNGGC
jgi:hypothetical protein